MDTIADELYFFDRLPHGFDILRKVNLIAIMKMCVFWQPIIHYPLGQVLHLYKDINLVEDCVDHPIDTRIGGLPAEHESNKFDLDCLPS